MPDGSISDHLHAGKSFDERECKQILAQSLDALAYLHSQEPRIVHRDVKPANILLLHRRPDDLFIKFADFGMSREGDILKTFCGTYAYLAPEVFEGEGVPRQQRPTYTALVDVWSLGVVLARLLCGLPKQEETESPGVEWCKSIRERVEQALLQARWQGRRPDLLSSVLELMLCLDPHDRKTAAECHKEALGLLIDNNSVAESDNGRGGEADGHHQHQRLDTEASTPGNVDGSLSLLSRYVYNTDELLERRQDRSCRAPSPETVVRLHAGQLLAKLRNPQDSLFCKSSFGETSQHSDPGSDGSTRAPATVMIAPDAVVEPQIREQEERPSDAPIREALGDFLENGTGASAKRSRPASRQVSCPPLPWYFYLWAWKLIWCHFS